MRFYRRAPGLPASLGILSSAFDPPTRAHMALAHAALAITDEVLFVLPGRFPHDKTYEGVGLAERVQMLEAAAGDGRCSSIAASEGGLFIDIVRECRAAYGPHVALKIICGRDAAERAIHWDYGRPGAFLEMLGEFELLVAPRGGSFEPPPEMRNRIHPLPIPEAYADYSATEVRARIARGEPWEHLVPDAVAPLVRHWYR